MSRRQPKAPFRAPRVARTGRGQSDLLLAQGTLPFLEMGSIARPQSRSERRVRFLNIGARSNIKIARERDKNSSFLLEAEGSQRLRSRLAERRKILNVVELFAGAGGMGLGFLLARRGHPAYKIVLSAEVDPIFVETLRANFRYLAEHILLEPGLVPASVSPVDLRSRSAQNDVLKAVGAAGGIDVLIGGPPCQGFSSANRNSWGGDNKFNKLLETFLHYVDVLEPRVVLLENVQGVLWTPHAGATSNGHSAAEYAALSLIRSGYLVFPKLLDAVWYGVPQYRTRFFLLALHRSLGYRYDDFGEWGPFPRPTHGPGTARRYTTVREAIGDLPPIGNGANESTLGYRAPSARALNGNEFLKQMRRWATRDVIHDHTTSRHADYVIARYRRIPPGGNWRDIARMMTNYEEIERTHSNIYRRLTWNEPSITIGNYRKSMLIHPEQHRGLSLREASRLQSFPDWFRFAGAAGAIEEGVHGQTFKQQQLANAVCPLVTAAVAKFILKL